MHLDRSRAARLERLVSFARAEVLIVSTWRFQLTVEQITGVLREHGFTGPVAGAIDPDGGDADREAKILRWLADHGGDVAGWVVLDDDGDLYSKALEHVVTTHYKVGLQEQHVAAALFALGLWVGDVARARLLKLAGTLRTLEPCAAAVIENQFCVTKQPRFVGREIRRLLGQAPPHERAER